MTSSPTGTTEPLGTSTPRLRRGTIGAFGLTFMVVAAAAPVTAMASNISLSLAFGVGKGTVGLLLVVAVLLTIFASAYVALSRHIVNAGAYYAFIGHGLGGAAGSGAAFVATLAYNLAAGGMMAATGYFADLTVINYFGVDLPWWLYSIVALAVTGFLGRRAVDVTQWFTTGISLLQFVMLIVLGVAIAVQRPSGWSLDVVSPAAMFKGNVALTLVFCVLSFVGFEATAIYGEEAKAARRSIRIATYSAIALLVGVFVFSTWSIAAAYGDVKAEAATDPGSLVFRTADLYLGSWSGGALSAMVTISFLASGVAFHNMAARYHFSLARAGMLPAGMARVHLVHGTPHWSSGAQCVFSVAMLLPFVLLGADPILNLFPAISGITSISLTALMLGCCISILVAARRGLLPESRWATIFAPAIAAVGLATILAIILANYQQVTGSTELVISLMPLLPLAALVYGVIAFRRAGRPSFDIGA